MLDANRAQAQDLINVSLWDISRKPKDIISTIVKRTKCLLLEMRSFLRKNFSQKKLVRLEEVRETQENVSVSIGEEVHQDEPTIVADQHAEPQARRSIQARCAPKKYTLLTTGQHDILLLDNERA